MALVAYAMHHLWTEKKYTYTTAGELGTNKQFRGQLAELSRINNKNPRSTRVFSSPDLLGRRDPSPCKSTLILHRSRGIEAGGRFFCFHLKIIFDDFVQQQLPLCYSYIFWARFIVSRKRPSLYASKNIPWRLIPRIMDIFRWCSVFSHTSCHIYNGKQKERPLASIISGGSQLINSIMSKGIPIGIPLLCFQFRWRQSFTLQIPPIFVVTRNHCFAHFRGTLHLYLVISLSQTKPRLVMEDIGLPLLTPEVHNAQL